MKLLRPWPDNLPSVPLGDLCDIKGGKPAPKAGILPADSPSGIPFIRMRDLGRHHVTSSLSDYADLIDPDFAEANGYTKLPVGSVLLPRSGSVALNHRAILGIEAAIVSHICALIVRDDSRCSHEFLFRVLCMMDMTKMSTKTTGLDAISFASLKTIQIPLPPLAEQKRIAAILDAADALRAKRREALDQLDDLLHSTFLEMFGDPALNPKDLPLVTLGELGDWHSGGTPPRNRKDYFTGTIPWFSSGELEDIYVSRSAEHVTKSAIAETSAKLVAAGSLMLGMYDTAALKAALSVVECSCNQAVAFSHLRPEVCDSVYVYFAITIGREHFRRLQRGVRQKNLNLRMVRDIRIPLAPLELQRQFAAVVGSVEEHKSLQRTHATELDNLFASLQSRAFRGDL